MDLFLPAVERAGWELAVFVTTIWASEIQQKMWWSGSGFVIGFCVTFKVLFGR